MIFPAARLDGLQFLDIQQPGPLIDHLLEMTQHLAGITSQLHGLGHVAPGPTMYLPLVLGKVISPVLRFHSSILDSRTSLGLAGTIVFALFAFFAVH